MISRELATDWLQRWDDQQTKYIPNRRERFEVIADLIEVCIDKLNPVIVDLGVGPGSLTRHLQERIPDATIIGLDKDPVLLEMSRAMDYDVRNVDLNAPDWWEQAGIDATPDAFVSTTALHWLDAEGFRTGGGPMPRGPGFRRCVYRWRPLLPPTCRRGTR